MYPSLPSICLALATAAAVLTGCNVNPDEANTQRDTMPMDANEALVNSLADAQPSDPGLTADAGAVAAAIEVFRAKTGRYPATDPDLLAEAFAQYTSGPNKIRNYSVSADRTSFNVCLVNPTTLTWVRWFGGDDVEGGAHTSTGTSEDAADLVFACE